MWLNSADEEGMYLTLTRLLGVFEVSGATINSSLVNHGVNQNRGILGTKEKGVRK